MNRLHQFAATSIDADERYEIDQATLSQCETDGSPRAIFAPLHYEPNYAYPLIVWLHGPSDDETQLQRVMPEISMRNYVGVGPRGPRSCTEGRGFTWSDVSLAVAERLVFSSIDAAKERLHIAERRVFLAGYEGGGTTAFRVALSHPGSFAGVLSFGGPFPLGKTPLARLAQARGLPLFVAQGRDSKVYPIDRTCAELRLFHAAGLRVNIRQYPCSDELNVQMLRDMDAWIMELVTGVPASAEGQSSCHDLGELN